MCAHVSYAQSPKLIAKFKSEKIKLHKFLWKLSLSFPFFQSCGDKNKEMNGKPTTKASSTEVESEVREISYVMKEKKEIVYKKENIFLLQIASMLFVETKFRHHHSVDHE